DASLLLLSWYRYCPADAPRMRSTWGRIRERLEIAPGLFRRYYGGLTAGEGAFGICSFWAAEYLALGGGTPAEAEEQLDTLLGAALPKGRDRAKVIGFFTHLLNGQLFALLYVAIFQATGEASALRGAIIGLVHAAVVLLVVIPLLPFIHPRMASLHQGPTELR